MAIVTWFTARRRLIGSVLVGWAVLVVIGSGEAPKDDQWIVLPDLGSLVVVVAGIFALMGAVLFTSLRFRRGSGFTPRKSQTVRTLIVTTIVIAFFATVFPNPQIAEEGDAFEQETAATDSQESGRADDALPLRPDETDIVALLVIGVLALAILLRNRRTDDVQELASEQVDADLGPAIEESIRHLQSEHEPRMAVMAAYASLERALSEQGRHRHPAETPTEHLARVLAEVPSLSGPAVRLGLLYERARFSDHPITHADRATAAAELTRARRLLVPQVAETY